MVVKNIEKYSAYIGAVKTIKNMAVTLVPFIVGLMGGLQLNVYEPLAFGIALVLSGVTYFVKNYFKNKDLGKVVA